jgi:indole-3-glycerol phosphate synthase
LARKKYEDFKTEEARASRDTTSALNALNEAQKAFDAAVAEIKKAAPRDSDWKRAEREKDYVRVEK